jgi:P27 family predicted phage terminase small subunit
MKPAALQILHGNPRGHSRKVLAARAAAEPASPNSGLDPFPDFTAAQRSIWDDAVANAPRDVLAQVDRHLLRCWVIACDLHRQACEEQQKVGVFPPASGKRTNAARGVSPLLSVINKQADLIKKLSAELGFSPTARPRLFTAGDPAMQPRIGRPPQNRAPITLDHYLAAAPARPGVN